MQNLLVKSIIVFTLAMPCIAGSLAGLPIGGLAGYDPTAFTIGWQFTVKSPVTITALGYLDATGAGLVEAHKAAIFDTSGVALITTTVQPGAAVAYQDGFRLSSVNYSLQPGTYVIGAQRLGNADPAVLRASSIRTAPQITYIQEREIAGTEFVMPTKNDSRNEPGTFGPSFVIAETTLPTRSISSIVNSGSYRAAFAAGMYVTIFGTNLSATTRGWNLSDFQGNLLPSSLDGVSVLVNGQPAYVEYISSGQINIILPESLPETAGVAVTVRNVNQPDISGWIEIKPAAPDFFTWLTGTPDSGKYVVATHADGTAIGKPGLYANLPPRFTTPAKPGETIVLYGTAFGKTTPIFPEGALADKAYPLAIIPTATVAGKTATVAYAGLVASLAKVYQINLTLPTDLADGDWPVIVTAGSQSSTVLVTVAR